MQEIPGAALIIIHGIGQQSPFETLDQFCRGIIAHRQFQVSHTEHKIEAISNNKGDSYIDSYVRIHLKENNRLAFLDVYEYYWANLTERQITTSEIGEWIAQTLKGAKKAYHNTPELHSIAAKQKKDYWYKLTGLLYKGMFIYRLLRILHFLIPNWLKSLKRAIEKKSEYVLISFVGDIAIYTGMDVKSKNFTIRSAILKGAVTLLKEITAKKVYKKVLIAGHSLGSVIAYDTLNKLQTEATLNEALREQTQKISSLLTFGSPLDKIYFFFNERYPRELYIRGQITENLHTFRISRRQAWEKPVASPVSRFLEKNITWYNLYHTNDPVSGRLDFFDVDENISCTFENKYDAWGLAHVGYWAYDAMYAQVYTLLFEGK